MATAEIGADIVKWTENEDGTLAVLGRATGPDLDHDNQICDPSWLASAMPKWMSTGGNIREQHSAIAAGVATELEKTADDGWMVTADVVDPVSVSKVKRGVLKGFSIGIKNARVVKDKTAKGGRIVGGDIVETSLVDRPCNPTCKLTIAKAAVPGLSAMDLDADKMLARVEELHEEAPRDRALALIADLEKKKGKHSVSTLKRIRDGLVECIKQELDEMCGGEDERMDLGTLSMSLSGLMSWWSREAREGEVAAPFPKEMDMADEAEVTKADGAAPAPEQPAEQAPAPAEKADTPDTTKAETPDVAKLVEDAVSKALEASDERVKALEAQIDVLKALPQTGGPVLTRTAEQKAKADAAEARDAEIAKFERLAKTVSDPSLAMAYRDQVNILKGIA